MRSWEIRPVQVLHLQKAARTAILASGLRAGGAVGGLAPGGPGGWA